MSGRNFRNAYLSSLGLRAAHSERSIELALQREHIDLPSLRSVCAQMGLPIKYRAEIWMLMMGVLPPQRLAWQFVEAQHRTMLNDLDEVAAVMPHGPFASLNVEENEGCRLALRYWLYSTRCYGGVPLVDAVEVALWSAARTSTTNGATASQHVEDERVTMLLNVSSVCVHVLDTLPRAFWAMHAVMSHGAQLLGDPRHVRRAIDLYSAHDKSSFAHVQRIGFDLSGLVSKWFTSLFATAVPLKSVILIWDRLVAVAPEEAAAVAAALLASLKTLILKARTALTLRTDLGQLHKDIDVRDVLTLAANMQSSLGVTARIPRD